MTTFDDQAGRANHLGYEDLHDLVPTDEPKSHTLSSCATVLAAPTNRCA
jgi:hypothetical protein